MHRRVVFSPHGQFNPREGDMPSNKFTWRSALDRAVVALILVAIFVGAAGSLMASPHLNSFTQVLGLLGLHLPRDPASAQLELAAVLGAAWFALFGLWHLPWLAVCGVVWAARRVSSSTREARHG
jgi:hypothetical protein